MTAAVPWRIVTAAIVVRVHLTPNAGRDRIDGSRALPQGAALKVYVRAVAEDGKANAALEAVLAEACGVAKRSVQITSGHASRLKSVTISGDATSIVSRLHAQVR